MFEHRQNLMDELMKENEDFRRIYNRHQQLDKHEPLPIRDDTERGSCF